MAPPSKRLKTTPVIDEINFDDSARHDYLTGFHKRKLQRTRQAQEAAEKKAKAERIEDRRKIREERKAELERHVQELNALLHTSNADESRNTDADEGATETESSDWDGLPEPAPSLGAVDHQAEYIDEDKYTTVMVEHMDASRDGLHQADQESSEVSDREQLSKGQNKPQKEKQVNKRPRSINGKVKTKKKKFRYESKTERRLNRVKEKVRNSKQARARKGG